MDSAYQFRAVPTARRMGTGFEVSLIGCYTRDMTPCVHWEELKYALRQVLHMVIITIWSTCRRAYFNYVCITEVVMSRVLLNPFTAGVAITPFENQPLINLPFTPNLHFPKIPKDSDRHQYTCRRFVWILYTTNGHTNAVESRASTQQQPTATSVLPNTPSHNQPINSIPDGILLLAVSLRLK
jgi:hypothetical protein